MDTKVVIYIHFCTFISFFEEKGALRTRNILEKMTQTQTVLIIERGLIIFSHPTLRLYSTYDRKFRVWKGFFEIQQGQLVF